MKNKHKLQNTTNTFSALVQVREETVQEHLTTGFILFPQENTQKGLKIISQQLKRLKRFFFSPCGIQIKEGQNKMFFLNYQKCFDYWRHDCLSFGVFLLVSISFKATFIITVQKPQAALIIQKLNHFREIPLRADEFV